jgi:hypothetical protein
MVEPFAKSFAESFTFSVAIRASRLNPPSQYRFVGGFAGMQVRRAVGYDLFILFLYAENGIQKTE